MGGRRIRGLLPEPSVIRGRTKKTMNPDECICGHLREEHRQEYPDDEIIRGECLAWYRGWLQILKLGHPCPCREFELPLHDNVYVCDGEYWWSHEPRLVHDKVRCRVCNGTLRTVRGQ